MFAFECILRLRNLCLKILHALVQLIDVGSDSVIFRFVLLCFSLELVKARSDLFEGLLFIHHVDELIGTEGKGGTP
jgi:hypothetical protein